jgi:predicted membrane-bound mannosyltransferase
MKYRIALWALAGFLIACFWALFAVVTFPSSSERIHDLWTVVCVTCPIAIAGMHYPISLYEVLAANTATYALAGLAVEFLRKRRHHTLHFKQMI